MRRRTLANLTDWPAEKVQRLRQVLKGPRLVRPEAGRVVRIVPDRHDRRIFTPTPYGSPSWKRGYRQRAALENARPDRSFEFEQHFIRGLSRMRTRMGLALSVMMALALGRMRAGCPNRGCARCTARFPPLSRGRRWADTG